MVAGVCGGLGQYLSVDSTLVRLFFVFMTFYHFLGVWAYLVLLLVMPLVSEGEEENISPIPLHDNPKATKLIGGGLLVLGTLALISNLSFSWLAWMNFSNLWPLLIILAGVVLLIRVFMVEDRDESIK
jgi:phage shock protein PspC (stress-responsive transcriptional regulator)